MERGGMREEEEEVTDSTAFWDLWLCGFVADGLGGCEVCRFNQQSRVPTLCKPIPIVFFLFLTHLSTILIFNAVVNNCAIFCVFNSMHVYTCSAAKVPNLENSATTLIPNLFCRPLILPTNAAVPQAGP